MLLLLFKKKDSIKNSSGPLLIEIEKSPGSSIGIKLTMAKSSMNGKNQILVESVKPASIADRCGAIYVGDAGRSQSNPQELCGRVLARRNTAAKSNDRQQVSDDAHAQQQQHDEHEHEHEHQLVDERQHQHADQLKQWQQQWQWHEWYEWQ